MPPEPISADLDGRRRSIRRRALANLILVLLEEARRSAGRFAVASAGPDAGLLRFREVRTLVRRRARFALERRDFTVVLAAPPLWPFTREAALLPVIIKPDDFAAPNSDGRLLCLDLQGIVPARLPAVLYDNLRLRVFRLDHCVDAAAADFVRAHLADFPADPRPLSPAEEGR
jgi:hypothetical protein